MIELDQEQIRDFSGSSIKNKVGGIFIPVRDIENSREWYADC